jgi:twitching motility two-component system response regulator PilH
VRTAENAEETLRLLAEDRPDLVLLDVVMPGLNGFQATRQLARDPDTSAIPVVMVSTKSQETDRVWAMRQGARGYLTKPIDERLLLQTIRQVLDGKPG